MDSGDLLGKWPTDRKLGHADVPTDGSLGQSLRQALSYALLVLLPLGMSWPVGAPAASNVLTAYVTPVLYPSDLVLVPLLLVVLASAARRFRRRLGAERRNAGRVDRHPESHAGPTQVGGGCLHAVHGSFGLPLLALALLAALTSPLAIAPSLAAYNAARWLLACAAYLAVSDSRVPVGKLAMVLVAGLGFQSLVGLGQVVLQRPLGLPLEMAMRPQEQGAPVLVAGGVRWLRASAMTFHPNVLGGLLVVGLILCLPLVARREMQALWCLLWAGMLVTFSRSAWLAAALCLPLAVGWLAVRRPDLRQSLAASLVGAAVVTGLWLASSGGLLWSRVQAMTSVERRSLDDRAGLQAVALGAIKERPLTGVGAGNFPLVTLAEGDMTPQPVHNVPLLLGAEVGVLGAGVWLWLCLLVMGTLLKGWRRGDAWVVLPLLAWLVLAVVALFDSYPWSLNAGQLLTASVLGLASRVLPESRHWLGQNGGGG